MSDYSAKLKEEKVLVTIAVAGIVLIFIAMVFAYYKNQYSRVDDIKEPIGIKNNDPFADIKLTAKSAVVWDIKNRTFLFRKNEQDILPLASLTKLMTTLAAVELLPEHSSVSIGQDNLSEARDQRLSLKKYWNIMDLISYTLTTSSNGGADAIAAAAGAFLPPSQTADPKALFLDYINMRGNKLGLSSTRFYNDSGLDVSTEKSGAYGSARDMAILMDYILKVHPEILEATKHASNVIVSDQNKTIMAENTNSTVESIPGILASKTGFTDLALGNLAIAFAPGLDGPYVAVVLGADYDGRFADMDKLVTATIKSIGE